MVKQSDADGWLASYAAVRMHLDPSHRSICVNPCCKYLWRKATRGTRSENSTQCEK
jgi:hypothetical protein